jgi:hypothetical protein
MNDINEILYLAKTKYILEKIENEKNKNIKAR